jgi:hypothetical protein
MTYDLLVQERLAERNALARAERLAYLARRCCRATLSMRIVRAVRAFRASPATPAC